MFHKEIIEFSSNLESLRDFVKLVDAHLEETSMADLKEDSTAFAPILLIMNKERPEEFKIDNETLDKLKNRFGSEINFVEKKTETGTKFSITLSEDGNKKFISALEKYSKNQHRKSSLHQSSLVTVISYVEWFLAQLIHNYYNKNPNAIGMKDKQLSLNDLYEMGSIEDAKKYLIDTKVESVLRGSLNDWINFLKDQMKLSMAYLNDHQSILIEACQRRNLYVHNGGVVNSIYLKNCDFSDRITPELGEKLLCDGEYIESILSAFEKTFLLISAELWKKNEVESEKRFSILNRLSYEHICNDRYEIGASLAFFLWGDKAQKESDRTKAQINYWQAMKWKGNFSSVKTDIQNSDFSAKDSIFILARHVLLDEFEEAFELLPTLLKSGRLSFTDLSEGPLFRNVRKDIKYNEIERDFGNQ